MRAATSAAWKRASSNRRATRIPLGCSSCRFHWIHTDGALKWASQNRSQAQAILNVPPLPETVNDDMEKDCCGKIASPPLSLENLDSFLDNRGWHVPHERGKKLLSHLLSSPLTFAFARQLLGNKSNNNKNRNIFWEKWNCIGARAEATLPTDIWKEVLLLASSPIRMEMSFIGPEVHIPRNRKRVLSYNEQDSRQLTLEWAFCGLYHTFVQQQKQELSRPHGCILYNPGFGHANLKKNWIPTLQILFEQQCPIVLTAHSARDADRDRNQLIQLFQQDQIQYVQNPFASQVTYEDPLEPGHFLSPNQYISILDGDGHCLFDNDEKQTLTQ